ncbi:MAG: sigma-70 family RNA polymerase sigma factor [Geodermatophilaceae bacterium]
MQLAVRQDPDATEGSGPSLHETLSRRSHDLLAQAAPPCPQPMRKELHTQVILLNRRVAAGIAARYNQRGVDGDDLRQVAEMGLIKAVRRYEPERGAGFLAYAVPTIRGEIRRYFRDNGWMVRPPRRIQELRSEVITAENDMVQELRRFPNVSETAEQMGLSTPELVEVQGARGCFRPASLDAPAREDASLPVGELIGEADSEFERVDNYASLAPLLAALTPRDRLILGLRFVHGYTQKEIGDRIGVSQMQVSRLLNAVLGRLREQLCAD